MRDVIKMEKQCQLRANDVLAIIIIIFGAVGFGLWGLGLSSVGNMALQWLGGSIVTFVACQEPPVIDGWHVIEQATSASGF